RTCVTFRFAAVRALLAVLATRFDAAFTRPAVRFIVVLTDARRLPPRDDTFFFVAVPRGALAAARVDFFFLPLDFFVPPLEARLTDRFAIPRPFVEVRPRLYPIAAY